MPKILFTSNQNINTNLKNATLNSNDVTSERDLLKKRSKQYVYFFSKLDHKALTETSGWAEAMKIIQEEFGTAELSSLPVGIVSKCYLGHPYEVHILDLSNTQIINHYKISETMPPDFEKARTLAKHNAYAFIEVYKDKLLIVREDGSATQL